MRARRSRTCATLALVAAIAVPAVPRAAVLIPGCADAAYPGGEWRSYGHDPQNSRSQPLETTINASTVRNLVPARVFRVSNPVPGGMLQPSGTFSNTPVVADGCVFLATNAGWVIALNADTLQVVWTAQFPSNGLTLVGSGIVGSPTVADGMVFVGVFRSGTPYVAAMDEATGAKLWERVVEVQPESFINAAPVYLDGLIFQGFAGWEDSEFPNPETARGGYAILDATRECDSPTAAEQSAGTFFCYDPVDDPGNPSAGGRILAHEYTISDAEYAAGYRGASVWCTAAVDVVGKYAYACGGNPSSKDKESRLSNALFKVDLDRSRTATFGKVVDSYKGETDQYYPGLDRQPACEATQGGQLPVYPWSLTCLQLDLDFGASPNVFTDSMGNLMIGGLQKSGVYHALYADHMQRAWTSVVAPPIAISNAGSPAVGAGRVYTYVTPGTIWGLDASSGKYRWAAPVGGGSPDIFQAVSFANGVAYFVDNLGFLNAFDASLGIQVDKRPLAADAGSADAVSRSSQGVAIARNTIYAPSGGNLVAYR